MLKIKRKNLLIYGPPDWINLVATVQKINPFEVTEMKQLVFFSIQKLIERHLSFEKINIKKSM